MCGAEPEFAAILADETRLLTCGRCEMRWPWLAVGCPWCLLTDRTRLRTFTSPDRRYRVCGLRRLPALSEGVRHARRDAARAAERRHDRHAAAGRGTGAAGVWVGKDEQRTRAGKKRVVSA